MVDVIFVGGLRKCHMGRELLVHEYRSEIWENNVFCIYTYIYNNHNDNGLDVTYCCSFGKWELYFMLSTRKPKRSCCFTINLITYLFTPWSKVLLEKLTGSQLIKKFLAFYGTRSLNTAFTSARHLSLS